MRSSSVERPRKNANPRTAPTVSQKSNAAPMKDARSAATIVRHARLNAWSTAERTVLPVRTSSFMRSKYTMYESVVTPTDTTMPVTPARLSAKPDELESAVMIE